MPEEPVMYLVDDQAHAPLPPNPTPSSQITELLSKQFLYVDGRRWDLLRTEIFATVRNRTWGGGGWEREGREEAP